MQVLFMGNGGYLETDVGLYRHTDVAMPPEGF